MCAYTSNRLRVLLLMALAVLLVIIAHKQKRVAGVLILLGLAPLSAQAVDRSDAGVAEANQRVKCLLADFAARVAHPLAVRPPASW